jgi:hypothetical protein
MACIGLGGIEYVGGEIDKTISKYKHTGTYI